MNMKENRQRDTQTPQEIKSVRTIRQVAGIVHAIVGGTLLGIGLLVFTLNFFFDHSSAVFALRIAGGTVALSGIIELIVAAVFRRLVHKEQNKLARLKTEGYSFPGEIVKIRRHLGVNLGHSVSAYAECTYQNKEGKTCLVKSRSFLYRDENISPFGARLHDTPSRSNYASWVYVNPYDPTDYAVEIFTQAPQVDYDYR